MTSCPPFTTCFPAVIASPRAATWPKWRAPPSRAPSSTRSAVEIATPTTGSGFATLRIASESFFLSSAKGERSKRSSLFLSHFPPLVPPFAALDLLPPLYIDVAPRPVVEREDSERGEEKAGERERRRMVRNCQMRHARTRNQKNPPFFSFLLSKVASAEVSPATSPTSTKAAWPASESEPKVTSYLTALGEQGRRRARPDEVREGRLHQAVQRRRLAMGPLGQKGQVHGVGRRLGPAARSQAE